MNATATSLKDRYETARQQHLEAARRLAQAQETEDQRLLVRLEHELAEAVAQRKKCFEDYMNE